MRRSLLTALCEAPGPPGAEGRVRDIVVPELEATCDRVERDPMGGVTGIIDHDGPTLMLLSLIHI